MDFHQLYPSWGGVMFWADVLHFQTGSCIAFASPLPSSTTLGKVWICSFNVLFVIYNLLDALQKLKTKISFRDLFFYPSCKKWPALSTSLVYARCCSWTVPRLPICGHSFCFFECVWCVSIQRIGLIYCELFFVFV